jgi:glyoxylase-like metal-dependent hydrolase (beta-lactamase superfamily II)
LLVTEKSKQLIEVGWLGGLQELRWGLTQQSFSVKDVTHVLITHYHIDHGALAQEMKDKGAKFIVMDSQREHLDT